MLTVDKELFDKYAIPGDRKRMMMDDDLLVIFHYLDQVDNRHRVVREWVAPTERVREKYLLGPILGEAEFEETLDNPISTVTWSYKWLSNHDYLVLAPNDPDHLSNRTSENATTGGTSMPKLSTWELIELAIQHADRVLLYGPPGTGKTHVAKTSGLTGERVLSVTLHEDSTTAELEGFYRPEGDVFTWMDGHAVNAWRFGHRLVLNEIDRAQGEVLTFLYGILDDPELAEMTIGSGETIRPSGRFKCVATMNGVPSHLPDALVDRFDAIIPVNEVNPKVYDDMPTAMAQLAKSKDVREKILGGAPSTRPVLAFNRLRKGMGDEAAAQVVFGKHANSIIDTLRVLEADEKVDTASA